MPTGVRLGSMSLRAAEDPEAERDDEGRFVGFVAPHFPLVVPRPWFDLYPPDRLPPVKRHPRDGHRRHPWVEADGQ